jgi:hypothetical protein
MLAMPCPHDSRVLFECVGDVVDELGGHQRLHETDQRHRQRVRRDRGERLHRERDVRDEEGRQTAGKLALVAHGGHLDREDHDGERHDHDGHQRRGDHPGHLGHEDHDQQSRRDQGIDQPRDPDQLRELRAVRRRTRS